MQKVICGTTDTPNLFLVFHKIKAWNSCVPQHISHTKSRKCVSLSVLPILVCSYPSERIKLFNKIILPQQCVYNPNFCWGILVSAFFARIESVYIRLSQNAVFQHSFWLKNNYFFRDKPYYRTIECVSSSALYACVFWVKLPPSTDRLERWITDATYCIDVGLSTYTVLEPLSC